MRTLFLDTETTGLKPPQDGIVEIAIVDESGDVVLDELVNPGRPIGFASSIHGITDEMVADAPPMELLLPSIERIVRDAHVVIYNAAFDTRFFPDELRGAAKISCAMHAFSRLFPPPRGGRSYRWWKLTAAAEHVGYEWDGAAHRALADARAARAVWDWTEARLQEQRGAA
jgi:DNA polymerase III subunit epsilon